VWQHEKTENRKPKGEHDDEGGTHFYRWRDGGEVLEETAVGRMPQEIQWSIFALDVSEFPHKEICVHDEIDTSVYMPNDTLFTSYFNMSVIH